MKGYIQAKQIVLSPTGVMIEDDEALTAIDAIKEGPVHEAEAFDIDELIAEFECLNPQFGRANYELIIVDD